MDITKPLKKIVSVQVEGATEDIIVLLVYERLPEFCFACGRIGHLLKDCNDTEVDKDKPEYESWLKAGSHTGGEKSRDEGRSSPHTTPSGSSTSNIKALSNRKGEGVEVQGEIMKSPTPLRFSQEAEEVVSSEGGTKQLLPSKPMERVELSELDIAKNMMGGDKEMSSTANFHNKVTGRMIEHDFSPQLPKLYLEGTQSQVKGGETDSTSFDTMASIGRSPKKWKKLARKAKRTKSSNLNEDPNQESKKRKTSTKHIF